MELNELTSKGYASIEDIGKVLEELRIARFSDEELVELTKNLFRFPTIIDAVTEHPEFYKKGFDLFLYYHDVKDKVTPKLAEGQAQRLTKFKRNLNRYISSNGETIRKPHRVILPEMYDLNEVKQHFRDLDVYDGRRFKTVLEGMTLALRCPEIVPKNAREAFGNRWYNVKQFNGDYEYGIKTAEELREDGRKGMFLEGTNNLKHYLRKKIKEKGK